jgi:hypothetical protein
MGRLPMARLGAGVERRRGKVMPLIEVKLFERPLENPEIPKQIIETLTGLCSVIGSRRATRSGWWWGSPRCWGIAGETADSR